MDVAHHGLRSSVLDQSLDSFEWSHLAGPIRTTARSRIMMAAKLSGQTDRLPDHTNIRHPGNSIGRSEGQVGSYERWNYFQGILLR